MHCPKYVNLRIEFYNTINNDIFRDMNIKDKWILLMLENYVAKLARYVQQLHYCRSDSTLEYVTKCDNYIIEHVVIFRIRSC